MLSPGCTLLEYWAGCSDNTVILCSVSVSGSNNAMDWEMCAAFCDFRISVECMLLAHKRKDN